MTNTRPTYWWHPLEPGGNHPTVAYGRDGGFVLRYRDAGWDLFEASGELLDRWQSLSCMRTGAPTFPPFSWANLCVRRLVRRRLVALGDVPPRKRLPPKPYDEIVALVASDPDFWRAVERLGTETLGVRSPLERKMAHLLLHVRSLEDLDKQER